MKYVADFETNNCENTRVWAYAFCEIGKEDDVKIGESIDEFMNYFLKKKYSKIYFHNLEFDGEFIISWCFKNGFKHSLERNPNNMEFTTLISDMGKIYSIKIKKGINIITIWDSLKLISLPVSKIPKAFNLPEEKGEIDYNKIREEGYHLSYEEKEYIKHDVIIVSKAMQKMNEMGVSSMTAGSSALKEYKDNCRYWRYYFDVYIDDKDIRQAYRGGWTYLKDGYSEKDIGEGIVLDVNSLYPSVMRNEKMPYGEGIYFTGKYEDDPIYDLYIIHISAIFKIKSGYLPTIQVKHSIYFNESDYLLSSDGKEIDLVLTNVDYELFIEHYNADIIFIDGWKFKSAHGMFNDYIDKWTEVKIESGKNGNGGMRFLAKLMLNSLYGKFATNPNVRSKIPYLDDDDIVRYKRGEMEKRKGVYLPVGIFITAWARNKTIRSAQKCFDRFVYADTDSLHLTGLDTPKELEIDDYKLGAWKIESKFEKARFLKQKCYIEQINGKLKVTIAGLPEKQHKQVTWENFHIGAIYEGKLKKTRVKGGVALLPSAHKIR